MAKDNQPVRPLPHVSQIDDADGGPASRQDISEMERLGIGIGTCADGGPVTAVRLLATELCPSTREGAAAYRDKAARLRLAAEAVAGEMIDAASSVLNKKV